MAKLKLTKGELKRQRDAVAQFRRYLPTLQLKKQQLQTKISEARKEFHDRRAQWEEKIRAIGVWAGLLGQGVVELKDWITPKQIVTQPMNIAGAPVRILRDVVFEQAQYDLFEMPLWVDRALEELRAMIRLQVEMAILEEQITCLQKELRVTTQRVNLFEKIMIPQGIENIRRIRIYLGDLQANAVGISKVAKKKIDLREQQEVLV